MPTIAGPEFDQSYSDEGTGYPVVALHAFPLDGSMWRFQVERLRDDARWIVPDLRGFGQSVSRDGEFGEDGLPAPRTMARFADDVADLLDRLGLAQAVLCGASMGGYVAFEFERRHGERLAGLILCGTRADADPPARVADRRRLAIETMERGTAPIVEAFSPKLLGKRTRAESPEKADEIVRILQNGDPVSIAATSLGLGQRADSSERLSRIRVPTLVLCGDEDLLTPRDAMQPMARAISGARFATIAGAGHLAPFECPQAVSAEIGDFLRTHFSKRA